MQSARCQTAAAANAPTATAATVERTGLSSCPTPSPWLERAGSDPLAAAAAAARLPAAASVVIIGGGLAGCSTAFHLSRRGVSSLLIEGRTLAGGATGRNGGVFAAGHASADAWAFERENISQLRALLEAEGAECEQRVGGYLTVEFEDTDAAAGLLDRSFDPETEEHWDAARVAAELQTDMLGGERIAGGLF